MYQLKRTWMKIAIFMGVEASASAVAGDKK